MHTPTHTPRGLAPAVNTGTMNVVPAALHAGLEVSPAPERHAGVAVFTPAADDSLRPPKPVQTKGVARWEDHTTMFFRWRRRPVLVDEPTDRRTRLVRRLRALLPELRGALDLEAGSNESILFAMSVALGVVGIGYGVSSLILGESPLLGLLAGAAVGLLTRALAGSVDDRVGLGAALTALVAILLGKVIIGSGADPSGVAGWLSHHVNFREILLVWIASPVFAFAAGALGRR